MKNYLTPKDLQLNLPERGDIAAWVDYGSKIPTYKCSNCNEYAFTFPSAYCARCGALMVNYEAVNKICEKIAQEVAK